MLVVIDGIYHFQMVLSIKDIKKVIQNKDSDRYEVNKDMKELSLSLGQLTDDEREIILKGCLI